MSFYIYETQAKPKCERCKTNDSLVDYELCKPCIHEMIVPGYSPMANELLSEHIRKEGAE